MLTDSHCHLASPKFSRDEVAALVARAREAGVTRLITLATCLDDHQAHLDLAQAYPDVHACLGIHPCDVHLAPDDATTRISARLATTRIAAIGETGLDYFHPAPDGWSEATYHQRQYDFLERHFQLAADHGLGIVIHTRDRRDPASFQDALTLSRRYADRVRAVFHCFVGTPDSARAVIELGGLVSFGGVATFKNARHVLEVAATLPLEHFMLETDSPYLAPHPHRGQRNEPAFVRLVAEHIAQARGISIETLASATSLTASRFFRLPA